MCKLSETEERQDQKKDYNGDSWSHPSSKVNLSYLSPNTKKRQLSNCRNHVFRSNQCRLFILVEQLVKLVETWIVASIKDLGMKEHAEKYDSLDERSHKIVSFVGFAVASTIKKYQNLEAKARHDDGEMKAYAIYAEIGTFV